ncbi:MAG: protein arginine kinase [Candidatus Kaelpia aquatica]|nr:protein arginine kinase [Candidatus Kaelpia aquatica]
MKNSNVDTLLNQPSAWLKGTGEDSDIVISSRVRFARNLKNIPFYHWGNDEQRQQSYSKIKEVLEDIPDFKNGIWLDMDGLSELDRYFLLERHLISKELADKGAYKADLVGDREIVSIMVNEEDHVRLQVLESGFSLLDAVNIARKIDSELAKRLDYAFNYELGYLTACPTNTGTGLRASVMLHLPLLVMSKQISNVINTIAKLSFTTRGFYGEGTEASGNFFQISNQVTLGRAEEEIIENLQKVIIQVISYERAAREKFQKKDKLSLEDQVFRSYGMLQNSRLINSKEAIELLSNLRLGADLGVIDIDLKQINELLLYIQPAHLQKFEGKVLSSKERDIKRARLIRERIA